MKRRFTRWVWFGVVGAACALSFHATPRSAQAQVVPGTGTKMQGGGDDFEDPEWSYEFHNPKHSVDVDEVSRHPEGFSQNRVWYEGNGRGHPDVIRRVETPPGGLEGSTGALLLASKFTGTPGRPTGKIEQDDLYMRIASKNGAYISTSRAPSFTVRVHVPPFEEWNQNNGSSFAVRATLRGPKPDGETKPFWPGLFFEYHNKNSNREGKDFAMLVIRSNEMGQDYYARRINAEDTGWWTCGMSFTGEGRVHYYAHPGIEELTSADHLASHVCYGMRAQLFFDVFFDVFHKADGRTTSTSWIIDDPMVFVANDRQQAARPTPRRW